MGRLVCVRAVSNVCFVRSREYLRFHRLSGITARSSMYAPVSRYFSSRIAFFGQLRGHVDMVFLTVCFCALVDRNARS